MVNTDRMGMGMRHTNSTNRMSAALSGRMARMAKTTSFKGLWSSGLLEPCLPAALMMASLSWIAPNTMLISCTARMGSSDASVTMPKPSRAWPVLVATALANTASASRFWRTLVMTPMPTASRMGTVTGPVVTPPQSHARPMRGLRSGLPHCIQHEHAMLGSSVHAMSGLSDQPLTKRSVPSTAAAPTPRPMHSTRISCWSFNT
mmetsp:Transcript_13672/g.33641  ORF Transcript_13672/g.33641 Transcript_13672/m.33641 type:complete len:204 (-) Transcript_13672:647-1258(-)